MAAILEMLCSGEMSEQEFNDMVRKIKDNMASRSIMLTTLQDEQSKDKKELAHMNHLWSEYLKKKNKVKKSQYVRKSIHTIEEVFSIMGQGKIVNEQGESINTDSLRYLTFREKGLKCVTCGLEGKYFAKEKDSKEDREVYHFNLYGIKNGEEVLFTRDHIKPRSKGGKDTLENMQTMCSPCNCRKGSQWDGEEPLTDD